MLYVVYAAFIYKQHSQVFVQFFFHIPCQSQNNFMEQYLTVTGCSDVVCTAFKVVVPAVFIKTMS